MNLVLILLPCFVPIFLHSSCPESNSPDDNSMKACISGSPFLGKKAKTNVFLEGYHQTLNEFLLVGRL